jgi:hypothetical protein
MSKEAVMTYFEVQPHSLAQETPEIQRIPQLRQQMPWSRYEEGTSQTQVKSVNCLKINLLGSFR